MGFTYDREDYTAAQLNDVWNSTVSSLASILPPDIRILESGLKFDDLVPEECKYTRRVNGPRDVVAAIGYFAGRSGFSGDWTAVSVGATSEDECIISVQNRFDTKVESYDYKDAVAIRPSLEFEFAQIREQNPELFSENATVDSNIDTKLFDIQLNELSELKKSNFGSFTLTGITSSSLVGITTTFSVTGLTYTGTKQISNSSLGWFDNDYTNIESFSSESGYDKWYLGVGTTVTQEDSWGGTGFNEWSYGTAYSLGQVDGFSDYNWPEGISPSAGSGGGSEISENLTSQINGITSTFSTSEMYVSGSLRVYYNGQRMVKDVTFSEVTSTTFSLTFVPTGGDVLNVDYTPLY